jgi:hypothetical protein
MTMTSSRKIATSNTTQSCDDWAAAVLDFQNQDIEPIFTEGAFLYLLEEAEEREVNVVELCEQILMTVAEQHLVKKIVRQKIWGPIPG